MSDFNQMFEILLGEEGPYQTDAQAVARHDPGGETHFGIIGTTLQDAIAQNIVPAGTILKDLTQDQAYKIYKAMYWDVVKGDQLPWPLNAFVFDSAVNQGCDAKSGFATQKMLQRALNCPQDGILGTQTITAAVKSNHWHAANFMAIRALRYTGTRHFDTNGKGWLIRIFGLAMKIGGGKDGTGN